MTTLTGFSEQKIKDFCDDFSDLWETTHGSPMVFEEDPRNLRGGKILVLKEPPSGIVGSGFAWFRFDRTYDDGDNTMWEMLCSDVMMRQLREYPEFQRKLEEHFKEKK